MLSLVIIIATHLRQGQAKHFSNEICMKTMGLQWGEEWGEPVPGRDCLSTLPWESHQTKRLGKVKSGAHYYSVLLHIILTFAYGCTGLQGRQLKINSQESLYQTSHHLQILSTLTRTCRYSHQTQHILFFGPGPVHWILTQSKSIFKPELPAEL